MPRQAFAEEFCESLLSSLVTNKGKNRGVVTIDDVDDLYHLITIRKESHRVNVCKIPDSFVHPVGQRLTGFFLIAEWQAPPKRQVRNWWIPTMTLKNQNRRLELQRRGGRRRKNQILA